MTSKRVSLLVLSIAAMFPVAAWADGKGASAGAGLQTGEAIVVDEDFSSRSVGRGAFLYRCAPDAREPAFTREPDLGLFSPVRDRADLQLGFTRDKAWLCFHVRNTMFVEELALSVGPSFTDEIDVVVVRDTGLYERSVLGTRIPDSYRHQNYDRYHVPIRVARGERVTVYLGFASSQSLHIDATLWEHNAFYSDSNLQSLLAGLFVGALFGALLYSLYLFISFRQSALAFLVLYVGALIMYSISVRGIGSAQLWPGNWWLDQRMPGLCVGFMGMFGLMFLRLRLGKRSLLIETPIRILLATLPVCMAGLLFGDYRFWMVVGSYIVIAILVMIVAACLQAILDGVRGAGLMLASCAVLAVGGFTTQLGTLGLAYEGMFALWRSGELMGGSVQAFMLSFGFVNAIEALKGEKQEAQARTIAALERSARLRHDFLASIASELLSPLTDIVSVVSRLQDDLAGRLDEGEFADFSIVKAEGAKLISAIDGIEQYARLKNGDFEFVRDVVSMPVLLESAASMARYMTSGCGVSIEVRAENALLAADSVQIGRYANMLCVDAVSRSAGGSVLLSGAVSEGKVAISVSDAGTPPDPEELARAFDDDAVDGLQGAFKAFDLFIMRTTLRAMDGELLYERSSDRRNVFTIVLPLGHGAYAAHEAGVEAALETRAEASPGLMERLQGFFGNLGRAKSPAPIERGDPVARSPGDAAVSESGPFDRFAAEIVIVVSDTIELTSLKALLEREGYRVRALTLAEEAIRLLERGETPDLVIVRSILHGMSGFDLCRRIRALPGDAAKVPVFVALDDLKADFVQEAFRAGADDYIVRWVADKAVLARIGRMISFKLLRDKTERDARSVAEFDHLRRLGTLSAGVAHEINTPNNAVLRDVPLLVRVWEQIVPILRGYFADHSGSLVGGWDWEKLSGSVPLMLDDMYRACLQIRKIVENLKTYARKPQSDLLEPVDCSTVCAYAERLLSGEIASRRIDFSLECDPGLPMVTGDSWKITQIVVNILENAFDAMDGNGHDGRKVVLRVLARGGGVVIECVDTGSGIKAEHVPLLFEPFFSTKSKTGGLGLGLPLSRDFAREFGGDIELEPRPEGGTVVRVSLPAPATDEGKKRE